MYLNIERWTLEKFGGISAFVYAEIAYFCKKGKLYGASQKYIASKLHCSVISVKRAVAKLAAGGWIVVHAAGRRKERNVYALNFEQASKAAAEWKARRAASLPDAVPDSLPVRDWMIQHFGHGVKCLIIANLYQIQSAETAAADAVRQLSEQFEGFTRGQLALCMQCGCKRTQLYEALQELIQSGFVQHGGLDLDFRVKQSRTVYYLNFEKLHAIVLRMNSTCENVTCEDKPMFGNDTCKPDECSGMILVKPDECSEMILANEYIPYDSNSGYECSARSAPSAPALCVENSNSAESEREQGTETSNDIFAEIEQEQSSNHEAEKKPDAETEARPDERPKTTSEDVLQAFMAECETAGYDADAISVKHQIDDNRRQETLSKVRRAIQ